MKVKETIGIDLSKLMIDACIHSLQIVMRFENITKGFKKMVKWVSENSSFSKEEILFVFEHTGQVLPKSGIGKAISYTLKLWAKLAAYTSDGVYEIDNNRIENTIIPLALGRKNYLFAGSHQAVQKAAMLYSFFATCKINNVNPYIWLKDVLERIPEHKANKLTELLPNNWNSAT